MLKEQAYNRFKKRLFAGDLKPGQFVSQRELVKVIGMPIGPVRDALKQLQAESLVRVIPQRGIHIADVNVKLVREAFGLRALIEGYAVRRFAETGDVARLTALEPKMHAIHARALESFTEDLAREFIRVDFKLHETLIAALDNSIIAEVYRVNADRVLLIRLTNRLSRARVLAASEEHLEIIAAIKRHDADAAAAAMERHLNGSLQGMLGIAPGQEKPKTSRRSAKAGKA
jgi:DNA-binding GntR family transcriptional regulator